MRGTAGGSRSGCSGKKFWVFGENFPDELRRGNPNDYEIGEQRVEATPEGAAETDPFLNAAQVMDREAAPHPGSRVL